MICIECGNDDKIKLGNDLTIEQIIDQCKHWKCQRCLMSPEEWQEMYENLGGKFDPQRWADR